MKKFAYYRSLSAQKRRIYDRSDGVTSVRVPAAAPLLEWSLRLESALRADDRAGSELAAQRLADGLAHRLHVMPVQVSVLAVRPSTRSSELHGLYEYGGRRKHPMISVWMRTAQKRQVVAFRTFFRTLLHEVVHHLDYQMLRLEDSYHTQGFYKRAESLYRQLTPLALQQADTAAEPAEPTGPTGRVTAGDSPAGARPARPVRPVPELAPRPSRPRPRPSRATDAGVAPAAPRRRRAVAPQVVEQPLLPFPDLATAGSQSDKKFLKLSRDDLNSSSV